jgi:DNA-binding FadR family transcriptional regulator
MHPNEVNRVEAALLTRIVGGAYPPGVRLPAETELARELGCGRSTVREALGRLATRGVVASRRGSGAHVLDWRREGTPALLPVYLAAGVGAAEIPRLVVELLHVRRLLAREAVRLASRYAPHDAFGPAREALAALERTDDPIERAMAELAFFQALVISSGVWPAVWLGNAFWAPMRQVNSVLAPLAGAPPPRHAQAIAKLLTLVESGDEAEAVAHLDRFLDRVDKDLERRLRTGLEEARA